MPNYLEQAASDILPDDTYLLSMQAVNTEVVKPGRDIACYIRFQLYIKNKFKKCGITLGVIFFRPSSIFVSVFFFLKGMTEKCGRFPRGKPAALTMRCSRHYYLPVSSASVVHVSWR